MSEAATESALAKRAGAYGLRFAESVPDAWIAPALARKLPVSWARAKRLLPVEVEGRPCLLTAAPEDIDSQQKAALLAGVSLEPVVAPAEAILGAIDRSFSEAREEHAAAREAEAGAAADGADFPAPEPASAPADLLSEGEASPVAALVNEILLRAIGERASDIHFEPFSDGLSVRFRIDGILYPRPSPPRAMEAAVVSRLKVMAGMDIAERRLPQDGLAEVRIGNKAVDVRVSSIPVSRGERIVMRLLNRDDAHLPLESLGMSGTMLKAFRSLMRVPNGIIVVSGPTGSGKTTTLYAALGEIDSSRRNILTIEDPVEYRLPGIGQIQVKPKIGLTFSSGLRHILRQDPDVILVGETRDPETAEIAVRASLTGHLVFTTLHTNDAPSAVMRLADMGVPPYLLASSLRGVLAQRLVRRLCPLCSERVAPDAAARNAAVELPAGWRDKLEATGLAVPRGCASCIDGHKGRVGVFELLPCTPEIAALIRKGAADGAELRHAAAGAGMLEMREDALEKLASGATDLAEVAGALSI